MALAVGFPRLARRTHAPGEVFLGQFNARLVYCLQGEHLPILLSGHGAAPQEVASVPGLTASIPAPVHLRPPRDRPLVLSWSSAAAAGDLTIIERGPVLRVSALRQHREASAHYVDIDIETGKVVPVTGGLVVRGWELVWFPLPGRPMALASYDGPAQSSARGSG